MPNNDPTQIRIAATCGIWKAPAGTPIPTDSTTAYNAAFVNLGYTSDQGFTITQNLKTTLIQAHQTTEPVRLLNASLDRKVNIESLESDKQNLQLGWGNGVVTQTGTSTSGAVTFSAGLITAATAHGLVAGNYAFFPSVTGTPGVVANVNYYVLAAPTTTTLTLAAAPGGTAITITTGSATAVINAGPYSIAIPDSAVAVEFILGIDWSDGSNNQRIIIPRGALLSLPAIKFARTDAIRYPLEVQALKPIDGSQSILPYGSDWAASS